MKFAASSNDLIGVYTIIVTISMADYPAITSQASFTVTINPCQVTSFTASITQAPTSYSIGTPASVGGLYTFTQEPAGCSYPQSLTLSDLPPFITHLEDQSQFSTFTDDHLNEGTYTVIITSTI